METFPLASRMKPFPTLHCVTGSMRRIYEFHDCPVSEELLLGLGSGVGFVYWHMKGAAPFIGGRANTGRPGEEGLEKTAGKRTGVSVEAYSTGSARKAEKTLLELIAAGEPVMLQVDMGFLPYFNFPEEYHFGGHVVVAAEYDPQSGQVLIADRETTFYPVSLDDLARARGSTYQPFPPRHTWYTFDFSGFRSPGPEEVRLAIAETARGVLEPPITNLGVSGIRKAASRMPKWPEVMSPDEVRYACFNTYIFIDAAGGTGGGIFRYMYGRFLLEAATITGDARMEEVGEQFRLIGDRWQTVAAMCREAAEAADPGAILSKVRGPLLEIASCEEQAWRALQSIG